MKSWISSLKKNKIMSHPEKVHTEFTNSRNNLFLQIYKKKYTYKLLEIYFISFSRSVYCFYWNPEDKQILPSFPIAFFFTSSANSFFAKSILLAASTTCITISMWTYSVALISWARIYFQQVSLYLYLSLDFQAILFVYLVKGFVKFFRLKENLFQIFDLIFTRFIVRNNNV